MGDEGEYAKNGERITNERARIIIKNCRETYTKVKDQDSYTEQDIITLMTVLGGIAVVNESVEAEKTEQESAKQSENDFLGQLIKLCIEDLKDTKELLKKRRGLTEQERIIEEKVGKKMKCLLGAINSCISEFEQRYLIERAKDDKEIGD